MPDLIPAMSRVRDAARSARFYRAAFGFDTADRPGFETFTPIDHAHAASGPEPELTVSTGHDGACDLGMGSARGWRFA
ncbi:VOC family protein [Methylobacterium sp. A52T]